MNTGLPSPSVEDLTFSGGSAADCEHFIMAVRRHALAAGRLRDNEWLVDFVSCRLSGDALRWHVDLPPEVADDWKQLQRALLTQYSPDRIHRRMPSAASDLSQAPGKDAPPVPIVKSESRLGLVKVESSNQILWISSEDGRLTSKRTSAAPVRCMPSDALIFSTSQFNFWGGPFCNSIPFGLTRRLGPDSNDLESDEAFCLTTVAAGLGSRFLTVGEDDTVRVTWASVALTPLIWYPDYSLPAYIRRYGNNPSPSYHLIFVVDEDKYRERYANSCSKLDKVRLSFATLSNIGG